MYYRQKKETKRKISFFMAVALIFSLLPVPAKAAENINVTLQGAVTNAIIKINDSPKEQGEPLTVPAGTVTITVEAKPGYIFTSADKVQLTIAPTGEPGSTPSATTTATANPSVSPAASTTPSATATATVSPSVSPAASATPSATAAATASPAVSPAASATPSATATATVSPTVSPAASATPSATATATASPTVSPAASATPSATAAATTSPTVSPAASATPSATTAASATPSAVATPSGTSITTYALGRSTVKGTLTSETVITFTLDGIEHDILVTVNGEATRKTGGEPSTPSSGPSIEPGEPTSGPSAEPSDEPTAGPSDEPTAGPSDEPTAEPSDEPTSGPSTGPGMTTEPTTEPTSEPSAEPSGEPTSKPTAGPTNSPSPDDNKYTVTFNKQNLIKATYEATYNGETLASGSIVSGGSIVSLTVKADSNCIFKTAPVVMVNNKAAELELNALDGSYSVKGNITIKSDTIVIISGTAFENYNVTINSKDLKDASVTATYNGNAFTGGKVLDGDTVAITITPKEGYAFNDIPVIKNGNTTISDIVKGAGGTYSANIKITGNTEINISGEAKIQKVTDASPSDNANNASLEDTDFTDDKVVDSFLTAFGNSEKVDTATAEKIKDAVSKNEAYIQAALTVTGATVSAKNEAKDLIKENAEGLGINTENISEENTAFFDITLESICKNSADNTTMASIIVEELDNKIAITMNLPKFPAIPSGKERKYVVIRIHGTGNAKKVEKLPDNDVKVTGKKIKLLSDKFSTYVITFEDTDKVTTPTEKPSNTQKPPYVPVIPGGNGGNGGSGSNGGGGGYVPSVSATPSATPNVSPSAVPSESAAPGTTASAAPGGTTGTGDNIPEATKTPVATKAPDNNTDNENNTGSTGTKIKKGKKVTVNSSKYKVTSVSGTKTVQFTGAKKNIKKVVIPSVVKISGKNFKVTTVANNALKGNKKITKLTIGANINKIGKNAFKGCSNLKNITIKTKKLTAKKIGKNAFKGINKNATIKVPKGKIKSYKKIIKAKGAAKKVKIKK